MGTARHVSLSQIRNLPRETEQAFRTIVEWWAQQVDDINDRIDKLLGSSGYFAKFDEDGNIADSGKLPPSGVVVGDTDEQTLTQKTLTTPTINQGTIEQPTINQGVLATPVVADLTGMNHIHAAASSGGTLGTDALGIAFLDQDNMASNSATSVASQQSIKKYVDDSVPTGWTGTFTSGDTPATTVTVANGIITGVA